MRRADRAWDAAALLLILAGAGWFTWGRQGLVSLSRGTHRGPAGATWVSVAERHDAQTRQGLWVAGFGIVVAGTSALRHAAARRVARVRARVGA